MNPRGPNAPRTAPSTTSRPFLNARYALVQISPPHSRKNTEYANIAPPPSCRVYPSQFANIINTAMAAPIR